eukprot:391153-Pyramimonas_sp.AAC.1
MIFIFRPPLLCSASCTSSSANADAARYFRRLPDCPALIRATRLAGVHGLAREDLSNAPMTSAGV